MTVAKTKIQVIPSDTIELSDGDSIRCHKNRGIVDALDVFNKLTKTASSAERLTWTRFKANNPGVHRVKWDVPQGGVGRIAVRVDLLARELCAFKRGKCPEAISIAADIDKFFPCAYLPISPEIVHTGANASASTKNVPVDNTNLLLVCIYALVCKQSGRMVYTGRTCHPELRFKQHAYESSKCRLVKAAFKRHSASNFYMRIVMRCYEKDARKNETVWIIKNNTMYPNGYNLVHGSAAGEDSVLQHTLSTEFTGVVPFSSNNEEAEALKDACQDLMLSLSNSESAQYEVLEYQTQHAKSLLDDRRVAEKIKRARELNDPELEKELKKRFLEM